MFNSPIFARKKDFFKEKGGARIVSAALFTIFFM